MAYNNTYYNKNYRYGFSSENAWQQQQQEKPVYEMQVKKLTVCVNKLTKSAAYMAVYDSENESTWKVVKGQQEKIVLEAILEVIDSVEKYGKHVVLYVPDAMTSLFSGVAVDYTINKRRSTGELVPDDIAELYSSVLNAWHKNYRKISLMRYNSQTKDYKTRCVEWSKKLFDDVECGRIEASNSSSMQPAPVLSPLEAKKLEYLEKADAALEADDMVKYEAYMNMASRLEEEVEA